MPPWLYETDENPKRKHHWDKSYAGFDRYQGHIVGKCPRNFSLSVAERLLNEGIPFSPKRWKETYPNRIYAVHEGVVYRATRTNPGISYHGFPEKPSDLRKLPSRLQEQILDRAKKLGCEQQTREWMNQ